MKNFSLAILVIIVLVLPFAFGYIFYSKQEGKTYSYFAEYSCWNCKKVYKVKCKKYMAVDDENKSKKDECPNCGFYLSKKLTNLF
jgi:hypothetical protein